MQLRIKNILTGLKEELPDFLFSFEKDTEKEFRRNYIDWKRECV